MVPRRGKAETAASDCARRPPQRRLHQTDHIPDSTGRITARAAQTDLHRQQNEFSGSGWITEAQNAPRSPFKWQLLFKNTSYATVQKRLQTRMNVLYQLACEHGPLPPLGARIDVPSCLCVWCSEGFGTSEG